MIDEKLKRKKNRANKEAKSPDAQAGADVHPSPMMRMCVMEELADLSNLRHP